MILIGKSIEFLLKKEYVSEFQIIDGLDQHPEGLNFLQWLNEKGFLEQQGPDYDNMAKDMEEDNINDGVPTPYDP